VIQPTVAHQSSPSFKQGIAKNSSTIFFKFVTGFHAISSNVSKQSDTKAGVTTASF
jgi:hypothetical protein